MTSDTIVREAARAVLASEHPVRVVDDGKLVGIVDDDAILRVVVAEEDAVRHDGATARPPRPELRCAAPPPAARRRRSASTRRPVAADRRRRASGSWSGRSPRAQDTLEIADRRARPTCTTGSRGSATAIDRPAADTNPFIQATSRGSPTRSTRSSTWLQQLFTVGDVPAPGAADRLARRRRDRGAGSRSPSPAGGIVAPGRRRRSSSFGFLGFWTDSHGPLIVTVRRRRDRAASSASRSGVWMGTATGSVTRDRHADPRRHADDAVLRLPAARSCCSSASAPPRPSWSPSSTRCRR